MQHAVSPFHCRKINDEFLLSEYKKAFDLNDICNIHQWYNNEIKPYMLDTLLISLTRKEIDALKVYATYWSIYRNHILENYDEIKENPSSLDKHPKNLLSVIEMHYKNIQTPTVNNNKWGEKFNHSLIDGMEKYIDSISSIQSKISSAIKSISMDTQNASYYLIPKLSTNMTLPFDAIYESMKIFDIVNDIQTKPEIKDGFEILRTFHNAVWESFKIKSDEIPDVIDIFCRSGLIVQQLNMALLKMTDDEETETKENDADNRLSLIFQIYKIPDVKVSECMMDRFLEFRMFISNGRPTMIAQIQTFLNIMSQDHIKEAAQSFLIPLQNETINQWNSVLIQQRNDDEKEERKDSADDLENFKDCIKRTLIEKYNQVRDTLELKDMKQFCIDFVIIRNGDNACNVTILNIRRLPIYPYEYGLIVWDSDKNIILREDEDNDACKVVIRESMDNESNDDHLEQVKHVLKANVYSCNMDYFIQRGWIQEEENTTKRSKNNSFKFCCVL